MINPAPFTFDESANSPDLSDPEVAGALPTTCVEDIAPHLKDQVCKTCGQFLGLVRHEKRFRFPHFYWRARLRCPEGHQDQRVFQVTWLYKPG